jgi:hypothetical protein
MLNNQEHPMNVSATEIMINVDTRQSLVQQFPQHRQIIEALDESDIENIKDICLNPEIQGYIAFDKLVQCRKQTLNLLKINTQAFLQLAIHELPVDEFLHSSDTIQELSLTNSDSFLELYQHNHQNWLELLNHSETQLANILKVMQLKKEKKLDVIISGNMFALFEELPEENIAFILESHDAIRMFCEEQKEDMEQFLKIPVPFIKFILKSININRHFWRFFIRHIPFASWPKTSVISETIIENIQQLLHHHC